MSKTDDILKKGMDIHEFIKTIAESKDLYNEEDYNKLLDIAEKEYHKYLKRKYLK